MILAESWWLITSLAAEQYRPPSSGYVPQPTLISDAYAHITEARHMQHTYAKHLHMHTCIQYTTIIHTFMASSKYSRVITLRNELIKGEMN